MATQKVEMFGKQTELEMGARVKVHEKPMWVTSSLDKTMLQWYAKIRSDWFALYSFGGGLWYGGSHSVGVNTPEITVAEYCTQEECAEQIVIYSKWMLERIIIMGRKPIAGDATNMLTGVMYAPMDDEWINGMKQRYSLYMSLDELYHATAGMIAEREINSDQIPVGELTAG